MYKKAIFKQKNRQKVHFLGKGNFGRRKIWKDFGYASDSSAIKS
jgi:hypothetical protein